MVKTKKKKKMQLKFVHLSDVHFGGGRMLGFRDWEDFCDAVNVMCGDMGVLMVYEHDGYGYLFVEDQVMYSVIPDEFKKKKWGFK